MTALNELASLIKEDYQRKGEEITDMEADEAARDLVGFFDLLAKLDFENKKLEKRLRTEPDGFAVEGNYSCLVCGHSINETTGWYHRGGQRCVSCHKAIMEGVIPQFVVWAHDSYYHLWSLEKFGVKAPAARKMVKDGRLKARIILGESGRPREYIFLKKENPGLIKYERYNPVRKSYNRHRVKWAAARSREEKNKAKNFKV